ncbi:MAG: alpha/beta hydrolase [Chitinophagales bacterium]|nr:alpha/beta hydrolase [Chitinophagales bacterium]
MVKRHKKKIGWLRRVAIGFTGVLILFIIACFIFDSRVQFRRDDDTMRQLFRERNLDATVNYYTSHGRRLRYIESGNDSLPVLLLLHGSPGSVSYYAGRMADTAIRKRFHVIAVDRPGYGYSGFGDPEPSIEKQAAMIRPLLDSLYTSKRPVIIAGGSYGASIACRITMDYPWLVDGLVLTGPSLAPGQEKYFWFTNIIEHWSIRWFIPRLFRSANTEKVYHKKELEKMLPLWENIKVPVAYLQGEDDNIVDTTNAGFARKMLIHAPFLDIKFIKGREHRLAKYEWPAIKTAIIEIYEKALNKTDQDPGEGETGL